MSIFFFLFQTAPPTLDEDTLVATSGVMALSAFTGAFMLEDDGDSSQSVEEGADEVRGARRAEFFGP